MNMRIDVEICTPEEDEEWALKDRQLNAPKVEVVDKEWSGPEDGLPPIDTVCEWSDCGRPHKRALVMGYYADNVWLRVFNSEADGDFFPITAHCKPGAFRPLRTPEQRAEEAKQVAISEIVNAIGWVNSCPGARDAAERVYEAGFRKTEGVEIKRGDV
ncbi:hypothetical protein [Vreelandella venusta]|uniref:hypothetical protein n=1 Tax=Vreelandella venusta TaxID=44935 RepID=UPI00200C8319|nr:hypothetical protein [Halomonas venusta]UQI42703.1 hypothetical protein M3L73_10755 [Halomonas venusta]